MALSYVTYYFYRGITNVSLYDVTNEELLGLLVGILALTATVFGIGVAVGMALP